MVAAHTASTAKVKTTTGGLSPAVTPDDTLAAKQQRTLDSSRPRPARTSTGLYAAAQVNAHQAALDALNGYAAAGERPAQGPRQGLIPTVTAHLNMAKGLK